MNTKPKLKVGETVFWNGRQGVIRLFDQDVSLIKFENGLTQITSRTAIEQALAAEELHIVVPQQAATLLTDAPESTVQEAIRIDAYCRELDKQRFPNSDATREDVIPRVAKDLGDDSAPGKSTVSRWYQRWLKNGRNPYAHLKRLKTETSTRRTPKEILDLIHEVIEDFYMKREKPTKLAAFEEFERRFADKGYTSKCPSERTFRRVLNEYDTFDMLEAREGRSAARAAARRVKTKFDITFPLERVELDSVHVNLPLNDDHGNYVGLVTIHFVIDCFSRSILGYSVHVGKRKEESGAIIHALRYAVSPKSDPDYPMCGRPYEIVHDGGVAYIALVSQWFMAALGSKLTTTETQAGWKKPFVERFHRTLRKDFLTQVPGYLGKRELDGYVDADLKQAAKLSVTEFRNLLHDYIVNEYHNKTHDGLKGASPKAVWEEGIKYAPPVLPANPVDLRNMRGMRVTRTLYRHSGVTVSYEDFHSRELEQLYDDCSLSASAKDGIKVDVLFDPLDAGAVTVVHPKTKGLIEAVNLDSNSDGKSFAELNALRKGNIERFGKRKAYNLEEAEKRLRRKHKKGPAVPLDTVDAPVNLDGLFGVEPETKKAKPRNTRRTSSPKRASHANTPRARARAQKQRLAKK